MTARRFALAIATAAILLMVVLTPLVPLVSAPAPPPFTTFGKAYLATGSPVNIGTPIRTFIDGVDYSNRTSVYRSDGSFYVDTFGNYETPATPTVKEGADIGDAVLYASSDLLGGAAGVFNETATWSVGGFLNQDLHTSSTQVPLPKIQSIAAMPGDGGDQYVYLCNPTSAAIDATQLRLQKDAPGSFNGPTLPVGAGTIRANGGRFYVNLGSTSWLTTTGDALKLVWVNPGPGGPNGGRNVTVDRVEFNATAGGSLYWEPGNTVMTNAAAPGIGQEIHRNFACADTNAGTDFTLGTEIGRLPAPMISVTYPTAASDFTGNTPHRIDWNMTSPYPDSSLVVNVSYSLDGTTFVSLASGLTRTDPSSLPWDVPIANTTTARVMVCARDLADVLGCGTSPAFTIDSAHPAVQLTDPLDGARGVPLNKVVTITFNEAMQPSPASVTITPAAGPITYAWTNAQTLEVRHSLFAGCQNYVVDVSGVFLDASVPGNTAVPYSFSFFTICAPTLVFGTPSGGQDFSGGSRQLVQWFMNDTQPGPLLTTWVNLSMDSGLTFPIALQPATLRSKGDAAFVWTVNMIDTLTARVQVCVMNDISETTCDMSPSDFRIDSTPPTVVAVTPPNGANQVLPNDPLKITFSEPMNQTSVVITVNPNPAPVSVQWNANSTIATVSHGPFAGGPFTVTVAATSADVSDPGNTLGAAYTFTFSLDTAPRVAIDAAGLAGCWCGGSSQPVNFLLTDSETQATDLVVYLNYTTAGGGGGPMTNQHTGWPSNAAFNWVVPSINDMGLLITITVLDPRGLSGQDTSPPIRIDSAAPSLFLSTPSNGAQAVVPDTAPIQLVFSEPMKKVATQGAISITPTLTGLSYAWDASGKFLNISHGAFEPGRTYTVSIGAAAVDNCTPGNAISPAPTTFTFTVAANNPPNVAFTSPVGSGNVWTTGESRSVRWTMTDETPAVQLLVWLNVTTTTGTLQLVTGQAGVTNSTWVVPPGLAGTSVAFHLDVIDAQGVKRSVTSVTVSIVGGGGGGGVSADLLPWILILIIVVVVVALLLLFLMRRRKKEPEETPPKEEAAAETADAPAEEPAEETAEEEAAEPEEVSPEELGSEEGTEETGP